MKNITVSVDDETYRRARIRAAEAGKSVSALVRDLLNAAPVRDAEFRRLEQLEIELRKKVGNFSASDRLSREELYDRKKWRSS